LHPELEGIVADIGIEEYYMLGVVLAALAAGCPRDTVVGQPDLRQDSCIQFVPHTGFAIV